MNIDQDEWRSKSRPKRLRMSLERVWEKGDDVWSLSVSVTNTRSQQPSWFTVTEFRGEDAPSVLSDVVGHEVSHFAGRHWHRKPLVGVQTPVDEDELPLG